MKATELKLVLLFFCWLTTGCRDQSYDGNPLAERYCDSMGKMLIIGSNKLYDKTKQAISLIQKKKKDLVKAFR